MGASQLKQDWKHHYTKLNTNSQSFSTIIQHNTTQEKFELISIRINQQAQKAKLQNKLQNRKTTKPQFIHHLEQVFYKEEDEFCGTSSKFQLVYEFGSNRLQSVFNQRKNKKLTFHDQEIFFIIINIFKALKEVEQLKEVHGNVNMHFILIGNSVILQDPILIENSHEDLVQIKSSMNSYPSPNRLLSRVDSGMNLDFFCQDLFSLGMIALQMYLPYENIKNAYKNKNTTYQNQRIDFNLLYQYLRFVKNPQLNECLRLLLSQIPKERRKVISVLMNVNVSMQNIGLLNLNKKVRTNQQELAQIFNPNVKSSSQQVRPQLCLSDNKIYTGQSNNYKIGQQNSQTVRHVRQNSYHLVSPPSSQQSIQKAYYNMPTQVPTYHANIQPHLVQNYRPKSYSSINFQHSNKQTRTIPIANGHFNLQNNQFIEIQPKSINVQLEKNQVQIKAPSQSIFIQKEKQQKHATPIKNLSQFISPTKNIPSSLQFDSVQRTQRRTSNQNLAALQQQFAQLEKLTKKNEQLKEKLNKQARNLFSTKQSMPVHSQVIVQETFQDSKIEEPCYVIQQYESGHKYEGYVHNKMKNGYGKFYYSGGSVYDGQWVDNKMCGYGQLFYPNGQLAYQGFFKNDEFQGKGTLKNDVSLPFTQNYDYRNFRNLKNSDWKLYDGEWSRDKKQGKGRLTLSNNQVFEGEFKQDKPHGYGIFKQLNGNKIKGIWNQGLLQSIIP